MLCQGEREAGRRRINISLFVLLLVKFDVEVREV